MICPFCSWRLSENCCTSGRALLADDYPDTLYPPLDISPSIVSHISKTVDAQHARNARVAAELERL